jgi:hypothetical protein
MALPLLRPMIVLDFDWTLLDCNSDTWVVEKLGASALMNSLHHTLPWTQLMVCFFSCASPPASSLCVCFVVVVFVVFFFLEMDSPASHTYWVNIIVGQNDEGAS